ncbi:MAG: class I SAM-dependent methyltransferase [Pyrinomonadaceae bacterium]
MKDNSNDWSKNVESWIKLVDEGLDPFRKYVLDPFLNQLIAANFKGLCLDIGCGEGTTSRLLQRNGCDVVAVDYELGFLRAAVSRSKDITYIQADAMHLPFRESIFDRVICKLASMSLADYDSFVKEIRRVLRPNARFLEVVTHPCFVTFRGDNNSPADYLSTAAKKTRWYCEGELLLNPVTNFHRPLQDYVSSFQRHGLRIVGLYEPSVPDEFLRMSQWKDAGFAGPPFLIFALTRA